jgi:acylphosphatase
MKTVHAIITGRVQGVFYRGWTVEQARALNLSGWVRNRPDGSVEAVFRGPPESVEVMVRRCHDGPPAARVDGVSVKPHDEDPGQGFRQIR